MNYEGRCPEPLELDLTKEALARFYEKTFDVALNADTQSFRIYEERLMGLFGSRIARYMVSRAIRDANDLARLPVTEGNDR